MRKNLHYDWHWTYELWQWRHGQSRHPSDGCRTLVSRREKAVPANDVHRWQARLKDDGETPNTQIVYHDYQVAQLIFETRGLPHDQAAQAGGKSGWGKNMDHPEEFPKEGGVGMVIQCENGRIYCGRSEVKVTDNQGKEGDLDQRANQLATRKYRAPYTVPKNV